MASLGEGLKGRIFPDLKNNAAADYKGPVKIGLLKGAGLLEFFDTTTTT